MNLRTEQLPATDTFGDIRAVLQLSIDRIPFTKTIDQRMRHLKARTGITPNIFARLGYCLSLEEPGVPEDPFSNEEIGREINRNTLLGENDAIFVALLRVWAREHMTGRELQQEQFDAMFVAHMNRGFEIISSRIRSLGDLANILPTKV